ncbi:MBL fold metallo-hydrolase [Chloroflexota bacterium]
MQKITDNVYVETEFTGCNTGFVVTTEGVVVIDSPQTPTDALKWRDEAAKHGPVKYLINTEPHDDHFAGNHFFQGTVVSHEGIREAVLAASVERYKELLRQIKPESLALMEGFRFRPPDITFSQRLTLYLGDHSFQLIHAPGHSPFQVVVYIPEERVAFTSDNVFYKLQSVLRQALPYESLDALKLIGELEADVLVPGHGDTCDRSYLPEMAAFIQEWIDAVNAAIASGMSLEEAQEKISFADRYPNIPGAPFTLEDVQRMNVARLYEMLSK